MKRDASRNNRVLQHVEANRRETLRQVALSEKNKKIKIAFVKLFSVK